MALRIEKAFGVKMETLLNMEAWNDAYTMRQWPGEIARQALPAPCPRTAPISKCRAEKRKRIPPLD
jgi:plasmid maintenance system antidote protein VapI